MYKCVIVYCIRTAIICISQLRTKMFFFYSFPAITSISNIIYIQSFKQNIISQTDYFYFIFVHADLL